MQSATERSLAEEWLPSRFNLAVFRLLGLLVALRVQQRSSAATILHHDREQHPLEPFTMSCILIAVPGVHFFAALLPRLRWPWMTAPLAIVALPFAVTLAWDIIVFSVALIVLIVQTATGTKLEAIRLQSPVIHSLMIALSIASIALAWRTSWLGVVWLALVALNAICALVLRAERDRIELFTRSVSQAP